MRIRLFETPRDQRLNLVASVLDKIAESRFGPGCTLIELEQFEEVFEKRVKFDLTAKCHVHCRSPHGVFEVGCRLWQHWHVFCARTALHSTRQARRLPLLPKTQGTAVRSATAQIIQYRSNSPP